MTGRAINTYVKLALVFVAVFGTWIFLLLGVRSPQAVQPVADGARNRLDLAVTTLPNGIRLRAVIERFGQPAMADEAATCFYPLQDGRCIAFLFFPTNELPHSASAPEITEIDDLQLVAVLLLDGRAPYAVLDGDYLFPPEMNGRHFTGFLCVEDNVSNGATVPANSSMERERRSASK